MTSDAQSAWDPQRAATAFTSVLRALMAPSSGVAGARTTSASSMFGGLPSTSPASYNWDALLAPFDTGTTQTAPSTSAPSTPAPGPIDPNNPLHSLPLPGDTLNVGAGRDFGEQRPGHVHQGEDLYAPMGTEVYSPGNGVITIADANGGAGGNQMFIQLESGELIRYFHLSNFALKAGDHVTGGQLVAHSGDTGSPGAPHLHMEVWQNGAPTDPVDWLEGAAAALGNPVSPPTVSSTTRKKVTEASPEERLGQAAKNVVMALAGQMPTSRSGEPDVTSETTVTTTPGTGEPSGNVQATGSWAEDILRGIGAPVTPESVRAMEAWMRAEGMNPELNNPLATTEGEGASGSINSVGVRRYPDQATGLAATIKTLNNGLYGPILEAFRRGASASEIAYAIGHSPWVGSDPAQQQAYYNLILKILGG